MVAGHRSLVLVVLCVSLLVVNLDNTILNVALPTIVRDLHASSSELQWVVDAYAVVFAGLLLVMGSLGDRIGRKKVFAVGLALFALGSAAAAFSASPDRLVAARAFMGVGAACIMPSTLSILINVFTDEASRAKAIGIWSGTTGLGVALGPIVGGWLLAHFWWGSVFLVNVPIALGGLLASLWLVPDSRNVEVVRPDPAGALLSIMGLGLLLWGIIEAPVRSWTSPAVLGALGGGALVLVLFVTWERHCRQPMLQVSLFASRRFSAAMGALALVIFALTGLLFVLTQWLQFALGYSPLAAGLRIGPIALVIVVAAPLSAVAARRLGTKPVVALGMSGIAVGLALLARLTTAGGYSQMVPAFVVLGAGVGFAFAPATEAVMGSLPRSRAGIGSATNSAALQVGGALGVGVLGSVLDARYRAQLTPLLGAHHVPVSIGHVIEGSLGGALAVAQRAGGSLGAALSSSARAAFVSGMDLAVFVGLWVVVAGVVVVVGFLPSRGAAVTPHPEEARRVGRAQRTETLGLDRAKDWAPVDDTWPGSGRARGRVLLETADAAEAWAVRRILGRAGYEVAWCPGPEGESERSCPLVTSGTCPLVDRADAVVSTLSVDHGRSREVLEALATRGSMLPVIVSCTPFQGRSWPSSLQGLRPLTVPVTPTKLLAALDAAVGRTPQEGS
jgi:EmrB/QacA subfamily drug resistance transporter